MRAYVGITDWDWFDLLRTQPSLEDVNFWQPGGSRIFGAINKAELFLFKLHSPRNFIVGGGVFAHATLLPISIAWETFGIANGARNLQEMRDRVQKYRRQPVDRLADYTIGCILLEQPFFLSEDRWIPTPSDWEPNIVQGRRYDMTVDPGKSLWDRLLDASSLGTLVSESKERYGKPTLTYPRIGQGTFRVLVTDAYERRCAITGERTLPALDAAHIKPYSESGGHRIENGLLLRRDLHALFDRGYITVTPDLRLEVSGRIREEFENGRDYYRHQGTIVRVPKDPAGRPSDECLQWHNENMFR